MEQDPLRVKQRDGLEGYKEYLEELEGFFRDVDKILKEWKDEIDDDF